MPARVPWNTYRIDGDVAYIVMRDGYEAIIDAEDLERARQVKWTARLRVRPNKRTGIYVHQVGYFDNQLHRFVLGAVSGEYVDHISHDGLDNRKANLRRATNQENMQNRAGPNRNSRSGVRGVSRYLNAQNGQTYWALRIWLGKNHPSGKRSVMKYFPYTDEGFREATEAAPRLRAELMTHA